MNACRSYFNSRVFAAYTCSHPIARHKLSATFVPADDLAFQPARRHVSSSIPKYALNISRGSNISLNNPEKSKKSKVVVVRSHPVNDDGTTSSYKSKFKPGDKIQVEVRMFGPLGATVDVIAHSHDDEDIIPDDQPPLARGLILQKEISYFRSQRNKVDVLKGEILPAYVESLRGEFNEDGVEKLNICLRSWGGKAKASAVSQQILAKLKASPDGAIPFGDRSSASYIQTEFPGISKVVFKKGLSSLYKQGIAKPGPYETKLMGNNTNATSA